MGSSFGGRKTWLPGLCVNVARTCLAVDEGRCLAGGCWEHRLWKRGVGYVFSAGELIVLPKPCVAFHGSRRAVQVPARSPYPDCVLPAMSVVLGQATEATHCSRRRLSVFTMLSRLAVLLGLARCSLECLSSDAAPNWGQTVPSALSFSDEPPSSADV